MILMWASSSEAEAEAEAVAAGLISRQHGEMRGLMHISTDLRGLVMGPKAMCRVSRLKYHTLTTLALPS